MNPCNTVFMNSFFFINVMLCIVNTFLCNHNNNNVNFLSFIVTLGVVRR
jgi:hypothetical protein